MKQIKSLLLPLLLAALLLCGCGQEGTTRVPPAFSQSASVELPVEATDSSLETSTFERSDGLTESPALPVTEAPEDSSTSPAQEKTETPAPDTVTTPTPENAPPPVEPENTSIAETAYTCTLSISCASILDHMGLLSPEKVGLVPEDGWILPPTEVTFYQGESVFNVLQRTCKQQRIHLEFEDTPLYNSAYIEGIHNLYEFDCGDLSGWMYQVNGWFPNYGCSRYQLQNGDVVAWEYTCDLGRDVNGYSSAAGA